MSFTPLGLPKAQPIAYIENNIAILSQLQLKLKANLIQNYVNLEDIHFGSTRDEKFQTRADFVCKMLTKRGVVI